MRLDDGLLTVAGESAAVVIKCHADAPSAAGLIFLDLVPVVRFLRDDIDHLRQLHILDDVAVGGGLVTLLGQVPHLERQRIHAQMVRQMGQMGLKAEQGLGRAEPAESAGGEGIGADALAL